ncbi:MAG: DUF6675 family protein [Rectinemataceae bacterium]
MTILLAVVLAQGVSAHAQQSAADYLAFLPTEARTTLLASGSVGDMGGSLDDLKLWQQSPFSADIRADYAARPSTISGECWFVLDSPKASGDAERSLKFFRSFTSFSTMKGLLVYSESLKKMETFIFDSYRVASLSDPRPIPDPSEVAVPPSTTYFLFQKQEQTGDVYSEMRIGSSADRFEVVLTNKTQMKFFLLTLVQPEGLLTTFYVVPTADKVLLYGITVAKTPTFLGIEKFKRKSFFNRMKALASWFQDNLKRQ